MRINIILILGIVAMFFINQSMKSAPQKGDAFPALTLAPINGSPPWSPDLLKGKTTLIQIFAAWCPHCANEVGDLVAIKQKFPNVQIIGIVWRDDEKHIPTFLQRYGNPYDHLWQETKNSVSDKLHVSGIPMLYLVNPDGKIEQSFSGELGADRLQNVLIPAIAASLSPTITIR